MAKLQETCAYLRYEKSLLKKYPQAKRDILRAKKKILKRPVRGVVYRGLNKMALRKIRVAIRVLRISPRKGLRLFYFYSEKRTKLYQFSFSKKAALKQKGRSWLSLIKLSMKLLMS